MFKSYNFCYALFFCGLTLSLNNYAATFSILSYNVQMRPVLDDNEYKAHHIGPKISGFDIVALQESFAAKDKLMSFCALPSKDHFTQKRCCFSWVDSGLSTLSRYPVILTVKEHYSSSAGFSDIIASKGIMLTRYMINGLTVDVYNTHMQASDGESGHTARFSQARQMVDFVARNSPSSHSVIVIGDFNMSPLRIMRATDKFRSEHYDDEKDMVQRGYAFSMMQESLGLQDLANKLGLVESEEVDRILFRSGDNHDLQPISIAKLNSFFTDDNNKPLSDSTPMLGKFSLGTSGTH